MNIILKISYRLSHKFTGFFKPRGMFVFAPYDSMLFARGVRVEMHRASKSAFMRGARFPPRIKQSHLVELGEDRGGSGPPPTTHNPHRVTHFVSRFWD